MYYLIHYLHHTLEEITIGDDDPDFFDDGAIDDLIKGRKFAAWRRL